MWDLCWAKWHWGRVPPSNSVSPANSHYTKCSIPNFRGWYNRPISGRHTKWTQSHPIKHSYLTDFGKSHLPSLFKSMSSVTRAILLPRLLLPRQLLLRLFRFVLVTVNLNSTAASTSASSASRNYISTACASSTCAFSKVKPCMISYRSYKKVNDAVC
jgi:hypothetical protein